jgi:hypothetical protein
VLSHTESERAQTPETVAFRRTRQSDLGAVALKVWLAQNALRRTTHLGEGLSGRIELVDAVARAIDWAMEESLPRSIRRADEAWP